MLHKKKRLFWVLGIYFSWFWVQNLKGQNAYIGLTFSNDLLNQTDRYYTNGLAISYAPEILQHKIFSSFVQPLYKENRVHYTGFQIFQDIYTPSVYNVNAYDPNDRPYAGVLGIQSLFIQEKGFTGLSHSWELTMGVLGEYALAGPTQNWIHERIDNLNALGWTYQVEPAILLGAKLQVEKCYNKKQLVHLGWIGGTELGNYKVNLNGGLLFGIGNGPLSYLNPYLPANTKRLQASFWGRSSLFAVVHDATLQGSFFSNTLYGMPYSQLEPLVWRNEFVFRLSFRQFNMNLMQTLISPEFKQAYWHKWLSISLGRMF